MYYEGGANVSAATATQNGAAIGRSIILRNVRLAFPDLFVAKKFEGGDGDPTYGGTFLIKPGSEADKQVRAAIASAARSKWNEKADAIMKSIEGRSKEFCYIDGNLKDYDGFAGMMALSAKRREDAGAPKVIDKDLSELHASDGKPYAGCYVNVKVSIWAQDNKWGKGMRATLETVQFLSHGDAFSGSGPATTDGFQAEADEESADDLQ